MARPTLIDELQRQGLDSHAARIALCRGRVRVQGRVVGVDEAQRDVAGLEVRVGQYGVRSTGSLF